MVFRQGPQTVPEEIDVWSSYLRKRGWRDDASKRLAERKKESGIDHRDEIQAFFDYLDADEGRDVRTQW